MLSLYDHWQAESGFVEYKLKSQGKDKDKDKDKNKDWSMPDERRPVDDNLRARDELVKIFMDAEDKNISAW